MSTPPSDDLTVQVEDLSAAETPTIEVEDLSAASAEDWYARKKAGDAFKIAIVIVGAFAGVLVITLIIVAGIVWKSGDPTRVQVFAEAVTRLYDSLGKFASTVFGSLLAFILGYYYSKEQKQN